MKKSLFEMVASLIQKHGADTEICHLPDSSTMTGGEFSQFLKALHGDGFDQTAYIDMRDNHAWMGTVQGWIVSEVNEAVQNGVENCLANS